ncbi:YjgF-like protein [Periconia macrospinosa]|uniref:YjgF-like protein n=1 Tax=Periconia macrospinosa TaxID=97972 RepID=A0A2V1D2C7_9PLEO|nr:YjgF-like protein [Periconia macrospinosa]
MSSLSYIDPPGPGEKASDTYHYSQSVALPSGIIKVSGQGGWDISQSIPSDMKSQIDLAFANVDRVLQSHGLRGWEDVYLWRSYAVGMDEAMKYLVPKLKERIPAHRPVWTALSVPRLGLEEMLIEIEVEAIAPPKRE